MIEKEGESERDRERKTVGESELVCECVIEKAGESERDLKLRKEFFLLS